MRSVADTEFTQHHVMLVLGESKRGFPIIMHMKAEPHWTLVEEELNHGKDLTLVQAKWPKEMALMLVEHAQQAYASKKFILSKEIINEQRQQISPHRPDASIDAAAKFNKLKALFNEEAILNFNPKPETKILMSCHEWALSMIHYACAKSKTPIPDALKIPPHLAWADRLAYSASQTKELPTTLLSLSENAIKERLGKPSISFFSEPPKPNVEVKVSTWSCPIQ